MCNGASAFCATDPAELPLNSLSDVLFSSYCILAQVQLLNSPRSQMVFIDAVYAEKSALQTRFHPAPIAGDMCVQGVAGTDRTAK